MMKPKIAFYWCASCGGCEEAVVDLGEGLLTVVELVEIAFWPVALDFKRQDVEALDDGELAAAFINGAVPHLGTGGRRGRRGASPPPWSRSAAARYWAASRAWPTCTRAGILDAVYREAPSVQNGDGTLPAEESRVAEGTLTLPAFSASVRTLDQVIEVYYDLLGCPPPTGLITSAVGALVGGKLPEKGAVLAPDVALCSECPRAATKPDKLRGRVPAAASGARSIRTCACSRKAWSASARLPVRAALPPAPAREHALHRLHGADERCRRRWGEGAVGHRVAPGREW